jgi:hypothetical protein
VTRRLVRTFLLEAGPLRLPLVLEDRVYGPAEVARLAGDLVAAAVAELTGAAVVPSVHLARYRSLDVDRTHRLVAPLREAVP